MEQIGNSCDIVIAHYHSSADQIEEMKTKLHCKIVPVQADFEDQQSTLRFVEAIKALDLDITHILHCASGRTEMKRFAKLPWENYQKMLDTQVRSLFYVLSAFLPEMAKRKAGKVVTVLSSYVTGMPPQCLNDYVTAKFALLGMIKALAAEYAAKSVQINAVSPSMMETKFLQNTPELAVAKNAMEHPLKRNATVEDVVPAILFLLSEQSNFITGQNYLVSGGAVI